MDTKMEALKHFKFLYEDKTGNVWDNRANFVKQPKKWEGDLQSLGEVV